MDLEELASRVKTNRDKLLVRQKEHYHYARELGFSANEAAVLQNQRKELILKLANERRSGDAE